MRRSHSSFSVEEELHTYLSGCINAEQGCSPERLLMIGILSRALLDLTSPSVEQYIWRSAYVWFRPKDKDSDYIFSYSSICDYVGFSARLRKHIEEQVKAILEIQKAREEYTREHEEQFLETQH
jgi:hypothetical protein